MSTPPNLGPESAVPSPGAKPPALPATRPMSWSVRRELWENRSLYIAPIAVSAVVLFGFLISAFTLPRRMHAASALDPARQHHAVSMPYHVVAGLVLVTTFLVGVFYCLDALHSERRDRSILFWKSLPVSDRTTVLSKASIPLVVLPLVAFALIVTSQWIMLLFSTLVLLGDAESVATLWTWSPLFQMLLVLLYALTAIALWHAPIYAWLLLISVWARRVPFLWALLPLLAISMFEGIAFRSAHFATQLKDRFVGWFPQAFAALARDGVPNDPLAQITPGRFLSAPDLWIGLAFAAVFLAAAVRLRRYREPI